MKLKIITLLLCCFSLVSAWSQSVISGKVTDESSSPLPGVSIMIKGTTIGATTDFEGNYKITAKKGDVLRFLYLGFKEQAITVASQKTINIVLKEDADELDEIIIIGYGKQKKASVLGAISQVKGEEIIQAGASNLTNALSGISSGVNIVQSSGQPGEDDGEIFIRGNSDPLILVDGVEIVGGFSTIDPQDVASISTLKDGAATAVYGIRGANGVILITTKRGKIGKPVVSVSSQFTVKTFENIYGALDSYSAQTARNVAVYNDASFNVGYATDEALSHYKSGDLPYLYPNTNWLDYVVDDFTTSYNSTIAVSGGTEFVKYYASAGYVREGDITRSNQFYDYDPEHRSERYNFRANLDFTLSKTTSLKTSVNNRLINVNNVGDPSTQKSAYLGLYTFEPSTIPFYPEEVLEQYPDPLYPGLSEVRFPTTRTIGNDRGGITTSNKTIFSIDLQLDQNLDFITEGLSFSAKYNFVTTTDVRKNVFEDLTLETRLDRYDLLFTEGGGYEWSAFESDDYEQPYNFTEGSEFINDTQEIDYIKAQLDYSRSFGKHSVTGLGVFSRTQKITNTEFPFYEEAWIARAAYDYDNRYFFEVSGSYNGDESFANGNKFKLFPSFSVGINLAKEKFIKDNIPAINNFKIRYSNGQTGSKSGLKIANTNPTEYNRWEFIGNYAETLPRETYRFLFGDGDTARQSIIVLTKNGNPDLTWTTVTKQNLGLEFGLFNNKISGELDFFVDNREGVIGRLTDTTIPQYFGITGTLPFVNVTNTESHGFESSLTYKDRIGDFKYSVTGIYSFNENRVLTSVADGVGTASYAAVAGKPSGTTALLQTDGYFQNIDEVVNYPEYASGFGLGDLRYIDYNANGTVIGSTTEDQIRFDLPKSPKHSYSLKLSGSYKNWSFSALVNAISGHEGLVSETLAYAISDGNASGRYEQLDYWTPTNTDAAYPALHVGTYNPNLASATTDRVVNLDYIKLRTMNIGYTFNMNNSKSIKNLKIYVSGNNLLTYSNLKYANPEGNSPGVYPILRRFNLGLNMSF
ncbi:MAG: TonB-dependent receptor [Polaribacter sp.]|uniref:SusC/RagA family TonB-linked outer membrane protein n=1 Tax=Polaribacter sp. TaxID=1920175 RepID=UPI003265FC49